jgi:chemotaxis protein CheD
MKVANGPDDVLVTYSLGSCVGLAIYDPGTKVGGLIHCMLPLSKIDASRSVKSPYMFVDSGVPLLLRAVLDLGAEKRRLVAKVAGAAQLMDSQNTFRIGERNMVVLRKLLWKNNILIAAEETGGNIARTLTLYLADGRTTIRNAGVERELA